MFKSNAFLFFLILGFILGSTIPKIFGIEIPLDPKLNAFDFIAIVLAIYFGIQSVMDIFVKGKIK